MGVVRKLKGGFPPPFVINCHPLPLLQVHLLPALRLPLCSSTLGKDLSEDELKEALRILDTSKDGYVQVRHNGALAASMLSVMKDDYFHLYLCEVFTFITAFYQGFFTFMKDLHFHESSHCSTSNRPACQHEPCALACVQFAEFVDWWVNGPRASASSGNGTST